MPTSTAKPAGLRLKNIRYQLKLSIRDVVAASENIAVIQKDRRYVISPSQIADMENHGRRVGICKMCSLSIIYDRPILEIISLFGIDAYKDADYSSCVSVSTTRPVDLFGSRRAFDVPLVFDPASSRRETTCLNRIVQEWGSVPVEFLSPLEFEKFLFVRLGDLDNLMHPMLRAGSIVKVDTSRREISGEPWSNEFERPIYLVETPGGMRCAWCVLAGKNLSLIPHPHSMKMPEIYRLRNEAEIIGLVVGSFSNFTPDGGQ